MNSLFKKGAQVSYEGFEDLHVSGHASREELKLLIAMTKPRYFIPIHGEYRHLIHHSNLAKEMRVEERNILLAEDGDVITIGKDGISITDKVATGHIYIDGKSIGDIEGTVLRDRHRLSEDGIVIVILPVSIQDKRVMRPEVFSRGFIYLKKEEGFFKKARDIIFNAVRECMMAEGADKFILETCAVDALKSYFRKETARSPMIVPIVIDI